MTERPYAVLGQRLADHWRPLAGDASALADPEFMAEVVEANVTAMAERLRPQLDELIAAMPWPARLAIRLLARVRR